MKRTKIYIILMLLGMVFLFDGCSKKDKDDDGPNLTCDQLVEDYLDAYNAFFVEQNFTEAACNAWKDALMDMLNGCPTLPAYYNREQLLQQIDEIDCSVYNTGK
ncbi:MAG: hypothetical protein JW723_05615 [Bacteroidales bacterium]|nr:hypothetical protein [Bacteroidales bacterium]